MVGDECVRYLAGRVRDTREQSGEHKHVFNCLASALTLEGRRGVRSCDDASHVLLKGDSVSNAICVAMV